MSKLDPSSNSTAMGELAAHLDRAWDLLQKGDLAGAERAAHAALALESDLPEIHHVLGNIASARHQTDTAVEHYEKALELDDSFLEAMLSLAEVELGQRNFARATELVDDADAWAETPEEQLDILLVRTDVCLAQQDRLGASKHIKKAAKLLENIQSRPEESDGEGPAALDPRAFALAIGRAMFETDDVEGAKPFIDQALELSPPNADALYYAGLIAEHDGNRAQAGMFYLQADMLTRRSDAAAAPFYSAETFEEKVRAAAMALDPKYQAMLQNTLWIVADYPGVELVADGMDPRSPIMMETDRELAARDAQNGGAFKEGRESVAARRASTPPPFAGTSDTPLHVVRAFVYARNVEKIAGAPENLEADLTKVLRDELDHILDVDDKKT